MSEEFKETLSALVDGELELESARETIDVLIESNALRAHWSRYHVVRDVMRHKAYPLAGVDLSERVRTSLADEPAHSRSGMDALERSTKAESIPLRRRASRRWRGALKPVAGLALAASVAVVAILAVRGGAETAPGEVAVAPVSQTSPTTTSASLGVARGTTAGAPAARLAAAEVASRGLRRLQWDTDRAAVANRLNGYLVNHSGYLGGPMQGMHPYRRIVGYDSTGQR